MCTLQWPRRVHIHGAPLVYLLTVRAGLPQNIRPALVEFSNWPTTPQLFIDGELIGGSDIVLEMYQNGELQAKIAGNASEA